MSTYFYRLLGDDGRVSRGFVSLSVGKDFSAKLWLERRHDAVVLSLHRLPSWAAPLQWLSAQLQRNRVTQQDVSAFLRDMSVMLGSGVPMFDALQTLAEEAELGEQLRIGAIARAVLEDLNTGASVSEAFERHSDLFPETIRNLVLLGEESGELHRMFLEGALHLERVHKMNQDARAAMIYPSFVLSAIFAAAAFWVFYVIPSMTQLFAQMNVKLPAITLGVLAAADWLTEHLGLTLLLLSLLLVGGWLTVSRSRWARRHLHLLLHKLPIARVLMHSSGMARLTEHLALLIRAGLDTVRSLEILERSTGDEYFRERLAALRTAVARGERIGTAMRQVGGFPPMAVRMIAVGEETGTLDKQLAHLAGEYRSRLDHLITSLAEVIKPAVILLAGALFMLLVVALFLPVYDLVKQAVAI